MDRLDAEHVLVCWDEASDQDRRAAAEYGVREATAELDRLEAELPVIVEAVCSGSDTVRDFPAMTRAPEAHVAVMSWSRTYPDLADEWDTLARRALAVVAVLTALDATGG